MMKRSYDTKYHAEKPTYRDVTVCKEWHNFQNFAEWFHEQPNAGTKGFELDKDLLIIGNKQYSPNSCSFTPSAVNSLIGNRYSTKSDLPAGVSRSGKLYCSSLSIEGKSVCLGFHFTVEDAHQAYKQAKERNIK